MIEMQELQIAEEKDLQDVRVYQICECDAVAAYTLDEAIEWYKMETGLSDCDLYPYDYIEEVSLSTYVYDDTRNAEIITLQEIVNRYWEGKPFRAITTDY